MKKFIALFLTSAIAFSTVACGNQKEIVSESENIQDQPTSLISLVDLSGEIGGEITVSCFETGMYKNYLEEAAQAFEEKYPDAKVNIEAFSSMPEQRTTTTEDGKKVSVITKNKEDDNSRIDYINQINTELMSGSGADILAIDVLPYYKYAENGQLEDLNQYMEADQDFDDSDYRKNILEGTQYKGGQYIFPINYSFQYLNYDATLLDEEAQEKMNQKDTFTYEELTEIAFDSFQAQKGKEQSSKMYNFLDGVGMFQAFFKEHYNEILNIEERTANFTDGTFAQILETAKAYGENGYINESIDKLEIDKDARPRYFYQTSDQMMLLQEFNNPSSAKIMLATNSVIGNTEDCEISGLLSNEQGEVAFDLRQGYGMNTNSQNKKTAWEFIKFLASEEMQTSMNLMGRPINNKAGEERAKLEITGQLFRPEENTGTAELTEEQEKIFKEYSETLNGFADQLNTYLIQDSVINEMINGEVRQFFDGRKTSEEVAETLQSKVELYLNE